MNLKRIPRGLARRVIQYYGRARDHVGWTLYKATRPRTIRWNGFQIKLGPHTSEECARCLWLGIYERGEIEIVTRFLESTDTVFEIGTGLGGVSLTAARKIGPARVFTYEANPLQERHIRENFQLNGLQPNLKIGLLGEGEGESDFFAAEAFEVSTAVKAVAGARTVKTPNLDLNEELRRVDPTFLIVDIEGGEYDLFNQIRDFGRIDKVAIELHPGVIGAEKIASVVAQLKDEGFIINPQYTVGQQLFASRMLLGQSERGKFQTFGATQTASDHKSVVRFLGP